MNKFVESIKKFFSRKQLKYGSYSVLITLFGVALVVLLNVGLKSLENRFDLKIDTTQNKKYSLSDATKKTVGALTKDIRIYTLYPAGGEDKQAVEIINKFKGLSGRVNVQNVDTELDPGFTQKFRKDNETIDPGSIIVADAENKLFRIIDKYGQYDYQTDQTTGQYYPAQIKVEGAIVNAINYIELGYMPTAFVVQGHGELPISSLGNVSANMSNQNYNLESVNIAQAPAGKLKAGDIILFFNPKTDISSEERDVLKPLMEKGGRFYFLFDPLTTSADKMPNLMSLLKLYDIGLKNGIVVETNQNNMYMPDYPNVLVPNIESHAVTAGITGNNIPVLVPNSGALALPDVAPESSMTISPLLKTSDKAYLKVVDVTNSGGDLSQKPEDETGAFTLAAAVEKTVGSNPAESVRFIVAYNTEFATNANLIRYSNLNFFLDGASWMRNAEKEIYVRPKVITSPVISISNANQLKLLVAVSVFLIPVAMLIIGIVIYIRRKHL